LAIVPSPFWIVTLGLVRLGKAYCIRDRLLPLRIFTAGMILSLFNYDPALFDWMNTNNMTS